MESIRSYDSLAQRRLEDDMLGLKPPTQPVRHGMKQETDPGFDAQNSAFYVPIPTNCNPTEILALRFQGMSSWELEAQFFEFCFVLFCFVLD